MRNTGEVMFETRSFARRLATMLSVDFRRMFTMPMLYILAGTSLVMPILVLVMTTMFGGEDAGAVMFTNVWQIISSPSSAGMAMDMTTMCNINLVYFLLMVLACTFVAGDFRSGYAKNLFTVRAQKGDYIASKTIVCVVGGAVMLLAFFAGAMLGGSIAGLSFDMGAADACGIVMCMLAKLGLVGVFVGIYVLVSVIGKQKLWLPITASLFAGMLLFMMIPLMTPLDAGIMHVVLCLAGGVMFCAGLGAAGKTVLNRTSLV